MKHPAPRRLNTETGRLVGEELLTVATDLRSGLHTHFAAGYDHEKWNDKLSKDLNITKYGFNEYLNSKKYDNLIAEAHPDLEWKKDLRHAFEEGQIAEE
eukprot:UN30459